MPCYNRDEQSTNYISRIIYGSDETSISMMRMNRASFFGLYDLQIAKKLLSDTLHVSIEEQAFMLESLIGVKFLLSRVTVSWYFNYVLCAIREYLNELI